MISSTSIIDLVNTTAQGTQAPASSEVDKTTFLKLLVMQLQYQDPINPMNSDDFMGQLAQFNALEQQMNLNDQFRSFLSFQALTQASSMLNKHVEAIHSDGSDTSLVQGTVEEVISLGTSSPILKLSSGHEVLLGAVVRVTES